MNIGKVWITPVSSFWLHPCTTPIPQRAHPQITCHTHRSYATPTNQAPDHMSAPDHMLPMYICMYIEPVFFMHHSLWHTSQITCHTLRSHATPTLPSHPCRAWYSPHAPLPSGAPSDHRLPAGLPVSHGGQLLPLPELPGREWSESCIQRHPSQGSAAVRSVGH